MLERRRRHAPAAARRRRTPAPRRRRHRRRFLRARRHRTSKSSTCSTCERPATRSSHPTARGLLFTVAVRRSHRSALLADLDRRPRARSSARPWGAARGRKAARPAGRPTASASRSQGRTGDGKSGIVIANADATRRSAAGRSDGHEPSAAAASASVSPGRPMGRRSRSSPRRRGPSRRWRPTRSSSRATGIVRRRAMAADSTTTGGSTSSSPTSRTKQVRQLTEGTNYEHSIDWSPDGKQLAVPLEPRARSRLLLQLRHLHDRRRLEGREAADRDEEQRVRPLVVAGRQDRSPTRASSG